MLKALAIAGRDKPKDAYDLRYVLLHDTRGATGVLTEAPKLGLRARWRLAMVLPRACALDKEANECVAALIVFGANQTEAERLANDDMSLDRYIALAPVCTYDELSHGIRPAFTALAKLTTYIMMRENECYR